MGRYRSRSRSYSPRRRTRSPPRPRRRFDEPRDRDSHRLNRSPPPSGLLIRNISLDATREDLRTPFERFGPIRDVYLPKNYYTGEPRGFGFVKFRNADDASEAKYHLNHTIIGRREISIVFAEENRKTPQEMRVTTRPSGRYGGGRRMLSPPYSGSPPPVRRNSRDRNRGARAYYSPSHSRSISHSVSPCSERDYRSKQKSLSPRDDDRTPREDYCRSPSPIENGRRSHENINHGRDWWSQSSQGHDRRLNSRSLLISRSPH